MSKFSQKSIHSNKIKIVGICGSPHVNGNTATLIKKALEGCREAGAETEFIPLANHKILYCKACYLCIEKGECVLNDDVKTIRQKMLQSDGIIIGSPTYNREITGQLKTFFDRLWYDIHRETFTGRYAVCINTHLFTSGCSQKTLKDLTLALGYTITAEINANLWKYKNKVSNDKKTMMKAYKSGYKLIKDIKTQKKYLTQKIIREAFIKPVFRKIDKLISNPEIYQTNRLI